VGFGSLLLIGLDPLIDFLPVGAVVADGGLDEAERDLEILSGSLPPSGWPRPANRLLLPPQRNIVRTSLVPPRRPPSI
jgi:hypothetical protein